MSFKNACFLSLLLLGVGNGGCILVASSRVDVTGSYVSPEVFGLIKDGETSRDWLISHLGTPTKVEDRADGMDDVIYEHAERIREHASAFLLFSFDRNVDRTQQCIFEMKDDIVQRHYRRYVDRRFEE